MVCEAIESVFTPARPSLNLEVIVVDDGSTDNTREAVKRYPIVYVEGTGRRASAARNTGLSKATGDFIAFLDDDDVWTADYPLSQIELLKNNPEIKAVISQIMVADQTLTPVSGPFPEWLPSGWIFEPLLDYVPVVGSVVSYRETFAEVGGFDTSLLGVEDWEWILRMARHGQIAFVPEVAIKYRVYTRSEQPTAARMDAEWGRFRERAEVFGRHTKHLSLGERIRLQPKFWRHRGFYADMFMNMASRHYSEGNTGLSLRSLQYALRASPLHASNWIVRKVRPDSH